MSTIVMVAITLCAVIFWNRPVYAESVLPCGPFTREVLAAPAKREAAADTRRFEAIKRAV